MFQICPLRVNLLLNVYFYFILTIVLQVFDFKFSAFFCTGIELIWGHGNLYQMVNALSTFTVALNFLTKVVSILFYRREIRQLFAR